MDLTKFKLMRYNVSFEVFFCRLLEMKAYLREKVFPFLKIDAANSKSSLAFESHS